MTSNLWSLVCVVLSIEPRTLCVPGKHPTNWATYPFPLRNSLKTIQYFYPLINPCNVFWSCSLPFSSPNSSRIQSLFPLPAHFMSPWVLNNPLESSWCCSYIYRHGATYWSVVNLPGTSPTLRIHQLFVSPLSILEQWLVWSFVGRLQATTAAVSSRVHHSCHAQKTRFPSWPLLALTVFPPHPRWPLSLGEGFGTDVPSVAERSFAYPVHFD